MPEPWAKELHYSLRLNSLKCMLNTNAYAITGSLIPGMSMPIIMALDMCLTSTQATWRTKAKLEFIENAIERMMEIAECAGVEKIALPAIGAGLGGLHGEMLNKY